MTLFSVCAVLMSAAVPEVAVISSEVGKDVSSVHLVSVGDTELPGPLVSFPHTPGAEVKASVLPGTRTVLAVAQLFPAKDESWASGLVRLSENEAPVMLADRVYHATRPLVTPQGRVFVQRGRMGPVPTDANAASGLLRIDELTVEEINPATGSARVWFEARGYIAFLAGFHSDEIFIYLVQPRAASLWAVNVNSGQKRILLPSMPEFARDFFVDVENQRILFMQLGDSKKDWEVQSLNVHSRQLVKLSRHAHLALFPSQLPTLGLLQNDGTDGFLSGKKGPDEVRHLSADRKWVLAIHHRPNALPLPFAYSLEDRRVVSLPSSEGFRIDVCGLIDGVSP